MNEYNVFWMWKMIECNKQWVLIKWINTLIFDWFVWLINWVLVFVTIQKEKLDLEPDQHSSDSIEGQVFYQCKYYFIHWTILLSITFLVLFWYLIIINHLTAKAKWEP